MRPSGNCSQRTRREVVLRYPGRTAENLPSLARLAYDLAARHCGACRDYHVMWPYLRSLGLQGGGPDHRFEEQRAAYAVAAGDGESTRWLIAGSADAGQLALVQAVADLRSERRFGITIVDRCPTPLGVARHHAQACGIDIETVQDDLMTFERPGGFDVVSMHHVVDFFPEEHRAPFMRHAATWLALGGRILLAVNFGPRDSVDGRSNAMRAWREAGIRSAAASGELDLPEDLETFVGRLQGMRDSRSNAPRSSHERPYYEALVEEAGLVVTDVVPLPFDGEGQDFHGQNPRQRCIIAAVRPER